MTREKTYDRKKHKHDTNTNKSIFSHSFYTHYPALFVTLHPSFIDISVPAPGCFLFFPLLFILFFFSCINSCLHSLYLSSLFFSIPFIFPSFDMPFLYSHRNKSKLSTYQLKKPDDEVQAAKSNYFSFSSSSKG